MSVKISPTPLATASIGTLLPVATMSPNARAAVAPPAAEQAVFRQHLAVIAVHASAAVAGHTEIKQSAVTARHTRAGIKVNCSKNVMAH